MDKTARELKAKGKSIREIAAELGVSKTTVGRMLKRPVVTKGFLNPTWKEVGGNDSRPADAWGALPAPDAATLLSLNEDTIFSCVDWSAKATAKSELKVLCTTHPGQKSPRCPTAPIIVKSQRLQRIAKAAKVSEVLNHPLVELLDHPCPEMSKYDWLYYLDTQLSLVGNGYVHVVREDYQCDKSGQPVVNEGLPVGLWPLMTQYVAQESDRGRIVGYKYSLTDEPIIYPRKDVIHFRMISHQNPYAQGYGPVRAVFERIMLGKYELAYLNSLFRNQARPDSLVQIKGGATADQCERLQKEMSMRFAKGGIGGPWVVDGDEMDVKNLSWSPKDVLGTELYKWTKLQIINAFALNAALFDTESSNRAVATQARIQSQEQCTEPRLRLIEERLQHFAKEEFDERLLVEFESPVDTDQDFELQRDKDYLTLGVFLPNEVRARLGMAPYEGGGAPKPEPQMPQMPQRPPQEGK